ncbi:hypothetical protein BH09MYX1_BH09MYX1_64450 [soil metagenome]
MKAFLAICAVVLSTLFVTVSALASETLEDRDLELELPTEPESVCVFIPRGRYDAPCGTLTDTQVAKAESATHDDVLTVFLVQVSSGTKHFLITVARYVGHVGTLPANDVDTYTAQLSSGFTRTSQASLDTPATTTLETIGGIQIVTTTLDATFTLGEKKSRLMTLMYGVYGGTTSYLFTVNCGPSVEADARAYMKRTFATMKLPVASGGGGSRMGDDTSFAARLGEITGRIIGTCMGLAFFGWLTWFIFVRRPKQTPNQR